MRENDFQPFSLRMPYISGIRVMTCGFGCRIYPATCTYERRLSSGKEFTFRRGSPFSGVTPAEWTTVAKGLKMQQGDSLRKFRLIFSKIRLIESSEVDDMQR